MDDPVRNVDVRRDDGRAIDVGDAALDARVGEALVEHPDPSRCEDVAAEALARRDMVQQHRGEDGTGDLVDAIDTKDVEEVLEGGVGRGEDGQLAVRRQRVDQAGADDGGDQLVELTGRGVDPDRGLDDVRAGLAGGGRDLPASAAGRRTGVERQSGAWMIPFLTCPRCRGSVETVR